MATPPTHALIGSMPLAGVTNWRACWAASRSPAKPAHTQNRCWNGHKPFDRHERIALMHASTFDRQQPALACQPVQIQFRTRTQLAHQAGAMDVDGLLTNPQLGR